MPIKRIQPTHLNADLPKELQDRGLETTSRVGSEVVDDLKVENLKKVRRGRLSFDQVVEKRATGTWIEETDVSVAGRQAYLEAMNRLDPQILKSLHKMVFKPHWNAWRGFLSIQGVQPRTANEAYADVRLSPTLSALPYRFSEMVRVFDDPWSAEEPARKALQALVAWSRDHQHKNKWLWDAAIHTIRAWLVDDVLPLGWQYWPEESLQIFQPTFGTWKPGPGSYSREQVRRLWTDRFQKLLRVYLDGIEMVELSRFRNVSRDLEIVVLSEQGKSPAQIQRRYKGLSVQRIGKIIERTLDRIGHQPRPPQGGKNARKSSRPGTEPADGQLDRLCRVVDEYTAKSLQERN